MCRFIGDLAHHDAQRPAAVHLDDERRCEAHGTHALALVVGGLPVEPLGGEDAVTHERVDGEVAYAKRGEVLEEVRPLARLDAVAAQARLDYHFRRRDVGPLDGDAEPRVARSPAAGADKHIGCALVEVLAVEAVYLLGQARVVGGVEVRRFDLFDVMHLFAHAVAERVG